MIAPGRAYGIWLTVGFVLWSVAFVALYGLHAVGCAWSWDSLRITLIGVWAIGLALIAFVIAYLRRLRRDTGEDSDAFLFAVSLALCLAGFGATVWIGVPVLALPVCA